MISPETAISQHAHLPVVAVQEQLRATLHKSHAILTSPTGSGKTTVVPLALLLHPHCAEQKIILLEPRRIAARAAAIRMSTMLGEQVGNTVGYRTRFESRISKNTRIEVVTEGILIRKLQNNPELSGTSLIIFDEYHERSIQADLGLALCLDLCELRDDLRLLVMSATLETDQLSQILGDCPHLKAEGKSFPVDIEYLPPRNHNKDSAKQMIVGLHHAINHTDGDILAFLPGAGEIHRCLQLAGDSFDHKLKILPLYGNLSHQEQDRVLQPKPNSERRIILSTPIAETSLTIEGISCVVDSGLCRRPLYDQASGLTRLVTSQISIASAKQRTGRAGRLGPGTCIRLWSHDIEYSMLPHTPPEILNTDLTSLILELALWGVHDPGQLKWIDPPRPSAWNKGVHLLQQLKLLDDKKQITENGRQVASLPLHPRLGVILVEGEKWGSAWAACKLAALLEERDIIKNRDANTDTDLETRLHILNSFEKGKSERTNAVDRRLVRRLLQQASMWLSLFKTKPEKERNGSNPDLGSLLAHGFPDRIAKLRPGSTNNYKLSNGRGAELHPSDPLNGSPYLVTPQVDARGKSGKIFLASPIEEQQLLTHHPDLFQKKEHVFWDKGAAKVQAVDECWLGKILISNTPLGTPDETSVLHAFLVGLQESGINHLPWDRESRELQQRIVFLHTCQPENWPNFDDAQLIADLDWLSPYCTGYTSQNDLKSLDLKTILLSRLKWEQQQQLAKLAPTHIAVPSGSRIRINYETANNPILPVRLQELFGLTETPKIANGAITLTLHLLSPARRPMQVTKDLKSFWQNTYPEVRKELAGRYPKHFWPEDPVNATATAKTKKQMKLV